MKSDTGATAILRREYSPYPWNIRHASFRFEIAEDATRVFSTLDVEPNPHAEPSDTILLDGQNLELKSLRLDGR